MRAPVVAYVGLGANLGDAQQALHDALAALAHAPGTRVLRSSRVYRSAPVEAAGPDFFNAVAEVETLLPAPELLEQLQSIEQAAGRERPYRNAPRTLDLDLLLYGGARIDSARLTVPHPRMRERAFVLLPLRELASALVGDADLAAVSGQRITALPPTSSPG
jgi:2-amino-4-hydroxy-6-hydroxymethyldihydropteridine diphosphokinase